MIRDRYGRELHVGDIVITRRGQRLVAGQLYREPTYGKMLGVSEWTGDGYVKTPCPNVSRNIIKITDDLVHLIR